MKAFTARTSDGRYGVVIGVKLFKQISRFCTKAEDNETGGIIVGHYSSDLANALVTEATPPPPDSEQGYAYFVRGASGLPELLQKRWAAKERTYYLGEWHFHPANVIEPSREDFDQMRQIADAKEYSCREPILLIVGRRFNKDTDRLIKMFVCPLNEPPLKLYRIKTET